jgi:hypothetical protein
MSAENSNGEPPGGGIKWHEGDTQGQCLCGTAPTAVTNLLIHKATGIQQYLTDGLRLYNWIKANRFGFFAFGFMPTFWPAKLYWALQAGESGIWLILVAGFLVHAFFLWLMARRFNKIMHQ